tara:strand:+ start:162 stop:701 length:540 start_codon:yes stop_codon:yes gene_type:complete
MKHRDFNFYEDGTHECYQLFRSKAKITTYKSLKWHLLVLWYLNPQLDPDDFLNLSQIIADKSNGFITFAVPPQLLKKIVYEVSMMDLDEPPKNKMRKVIFTWHCTLSTEEKLKIVGKLIGRTKSVHADDIYECMIDINDMGDKITLDRIASLLDCSKRTIQRNMCEELKREKELLNQQL